MPLLGPAADKLGIDLIWFGVLLGVNMQTSFMHPPFGFALFYLRSVAPRDALSRQDHRRRTEPVTTGQIYWGAVPFVVHPGHHGGARHRVPADDHALQIGRLDVDPSTIEITAAADSAARMGWARHLTSASHPDLSQAPDMGQPPDLSQPPDLGQPPPDPAQPPDFSPPPKIE